LAKRLNFLKVEVRIDSNEFVRDINHKKNSTVYGKLLVDQICKMLEKDWEVVVKHFYRETNQIADALVKHSYSLSDACFMLGSSE
jgi:ribonuclease HI